MGWLLAGAVQASVLCTTFTGSQELFTEGCTRTVHTNPGIRWREVVVLCEVLHSLLAEIDGTKDFGILRFKTVYDPVEAGANLVLHVW